MEIESESKLKKQAIHIESLSSRIDRLESDRKLLYDENTELKSQIEEMVIMISECLKRNHANNEKIILCGDLNVPAEEKKDEKTN